MSKKQRQCAEKEKQCLQCGIDFFPQCNARWHRAKFCSRECHGRWTGLKSKGIKKPWSEARKRDAQGRFAGNKHPRWRGGYSVRPDGYVQVIPESGGRQELEHRLVAGKALGRPLKPTEFVHHIDLDRSNNRNDNLLICTQEYHAMLHRFMEEAWVKEHILAKRQ